MARKITPIYCNQSPYSKPLILYKTEREQRRNTKKWKQLKIQTKRTSKPKPKPSRRTIQNNHTFHKRRGRKKKLQTKLSNEFIILHSSLSYANKAKWKFRIRREKIKETNIWCSQKHFPDSAQIENIKLEINQIECLKYPFKGYHKYSSLCCL